jgi:hypothetical protein
MLIGRCVAGERSIGPQRLKSPRQQREERGAAVPEGVNEALGCAITKIKSRAPKKKGHINPSGDLPPRSPKE